MKLAGTALARKALANTGLHYIRLFTQKLVSGGRTHKIYGFYTMLEARRLAVELIALGAKNPRVVESHTRRGVSTGIRFEV
jgi:hypothetical protein